MRLVKKYTCRRGDGEENQSSWDNLENVKRQSERGKGLAEQAGTDSLSRTSNSWHSTNDVMRPNNEDEDWAKCAGYGDKTEQVERRLANHA